MGIRNFARSLVPGHDAALAQSYDGRESASEQAARQRRAGHRARVFRDGDAAGRRLPRRLLSNDE